MVSSVNSVCQHRPKVCENFGVLEVKNTWEHLLPASEAAKVCFSKLGGGAGGEPDSPSQISEAGKFELEGVDEKRSNLRHVCSDVIPFYQDSTRTQCLKMSLLKVSSPDLTFPV